LRLSKLGKQCLLVLLTSFVSLTFAYSQNIASINNVVETLETLIDGRDEDNALQYIDSVQTDNPNFYRENLEIFLRCEGMCHSNNGDFTAAFKLFFDALKLSQKKKSDIETAKNNMELGLVFLHFGEPRIAIKMFQEAEELFRTLDKDKLANQTRYYRAISHKRLGEFEESNTILEEVKTYHETQGDSIDMAKTYNAIGVNYKNLKQVDLAVKCFKKAIALYEQLNRPRQMAKAHNNLANAYQIGESWDLAVLSHENSIKLKESLNDTLGIAISYINLSVIYKRTNMVDSAFLYGNKSIEMLEQVGERANKQKMGIYGLMSELHEQQGDHEKALEYAKQEKELRMMARRDQEATLIDLFTKKQDVKFYTISDSLLKNLEVLQGKIDATESENQALTEEKSSVINFAFIAVISLLLIIVVVVYWRFLSAKRMQKELGAINEELYATRISKDEKEVLLQEIHHRVKNNMQIISSLIRLQSNQSEDQSLHGLFTETQNRINSMALVHEFLYKTKNFEKLELKGYLTELVNHLFRSYEMDTDISKTMDISSNHASIDSIIPIGLIVNEAISNSLKHGFHGRDEGAVTILFYEKEGQGFVLEISDDGNGGVEEKEGKPSSLGMELIDSLVSQLDGVMTLDKTNGYHYTIQIPKI
jgi:two-component sensor histidine kinase